MMDSRNIYKRTMWMQEHRAVIHTETADELSDRPMKLPRDKNKVPARFRGYKEHVFTLPGGQQVPRRFEFDISTTNIGDLGIEEALDKYDSLLPAAIETEGKRLVAELQELQRRQAESILLAPPGATMPPFTPERKIRLQ